MASTPQKTPRASNEALARLTRYAGVGLLLVLAFAAFLFLFDDLAGQVSSGPKDALPRDLLERDSDAGSSLTLPNAARLTAGLLILGAVGLAAGSLLFLGKSRRALLVAGAVAATVLVTVVVLVSSGALDRGASGAGHVVDLDDVDPAWFVALAGLSLGIIALVIWRPAFLPFARKKRPR